MCNEKWILYDNQISGWTEKKLQSTSQSQTCTKKRSLSLFGDLLMFWATAAFWILVKPLHLRSMPSKLMTCSKCLQPVLVNRKGPVLHDHSPTACCTASASEVEWLGLWSFASYAIFTWPLANWQLLPQASWQLFLQGKCFHNYQEAEDTFQEFIESRSLDFQATGINQLFSCWQKCVDCNDFSSD